jgi:DNA-binding NtrC family response regulator
MFGHVRGAFTGAAQAHRGLFAEANGGTLLLDEVGDMPLVLQPKLLRVLQSGEFRAVGGDRVHKVDVRVIAATHRDLAERVQAGTFREDLYYRLNVVPIKVPPLRERREDIPELAIHLLARAKMRATSSPVEKIGDALIELLAAESWPGNVRELESVIERLVVLSTDRELDASHLALVQERVEKPATTVVPEAELYSVERLIERHVEAILAHTSGNKPRAVEILGIDLSTLYRWQRKWRRTPEA